MKWWAWLIPVGLAVVVYAPSLRGELSWDDEIVQKRQMLAFQPDPDLGPLGSVFSSIRKSFFPPPGIREWATTYYRPMIVLSYLLDKTLFGAGATTGPRAMVLLYHLIATFFVWVLLRQVLGRHRAGKWGAIVGAAIFAVHPIHTESVCWISGRSDTVAAALLLPALAVGLHARDTRRGWVALLCVVLAPLLFLGALLAKEVSIAGLLLLPLLYVLRQRPAVEVGPNAPDSEGHGSAHDSAASGPRGIGVGVPVALLAFFAAATVAYFLLRNAADITIGRAIPGVGGLVLVQRVSAALAYYGWKVLVPPPQCSFPYFLPPLGWGLVAVGAAVVLLAVGGWSWRRGRPLLLLAVLWFGLTIAPSLLIAVRTISETPVAERYLYVPSVALAFIVGGLFAAAWQRKWSRVVALAAAVGVCTAYGYGTVDRGRVWQNEQTLWEDAAKKVPDVSNPWHGLGMVMTRQCADFSRAGQIAESEAARQKAIDYFSQALAARHSDAESQALAHNNIGQLMMDRGPANFEEAELHLRAAIQIQPTYETPYYGLGVIALQKERQQRQQTKQLDSKLILEARNNLQQAVRINPLYTKAWYYYGECEGLVAALYLMRQDMAKAKEFLSSSEAAYARVIRLEPQSSFARNAAPKLEVIRKQLAAMPAAPPSTQPAAPGEFP